MSLAERQWYEDLGALLRDERGKRGWTVYDAAAVAGVSHSTISRWERGLDRMKAWHYRLLRDEGLL